MARTTKTEDERSTDRARVEMEERAPDEPTDLPKRSWLGVLKRTGKEFQDDNLTDWAAALTYYGLLALFPGVLVLVSLLGIFGEHPRTTNTVLDIVRDLGPASAVDTFRQPIEGVIRSKGGAGALLSIGLVAALWSASGYVGAFMRASNAIYEVEEGRPFWKLRPLQIVITLVMTILVAACAIALVVSGPVAKAVGDAIGLGDTAVTVWNIAKWPVMLVVIMTLIAFLYYVAPNVKPASFKWISPGSVVAVLVWIVASAAFAFYVANFGSYNETYGTLGGLIVLLLWMWISNLAILFGLELNAELERERELKAGKHPKDTIALEPRDTKKWDDETKEEWERRRKAPPRGEGETA
jgi:membrane protein